MASAASSRARRIDLALPGVQHQVLSLTPDDSPSVMASLRRLPLLGLLAPPRQTPVLGRMAVYRVRLQLVLCGPPPQCLYQGVLVDAAPGAR